MFIFQAWSLNIMENFFLILSQDFQGAAYDRSVLLERKEVDLEDDFLERKCNFENTILI